jgi:hypothetical protein
MKRLTRDEELLSLLSEVYSLPPAMRSEWVLTRLADTLRAMDMETLLQFRSDTRGNGATAAIIDLVEGQIALREILRP